MLRATLKVRLCITPILVRTTLCYTHSSPQVLLLYHKVLRHYELVLLQYFSVPQRTTSATPVLLKNYSIVPCPTFAPVQSNSPVLQSTTPVLTCTAMHYLVLQSIGRVLLCTTKYCFSTPLYYPVLQSALLQYYSVLQRTTPVNGEQKFGTCRTTSGTMSKRRPAVSSSTK